MLSLFELKQVRYKFFTDDKYIQEDVDDNDVDDDNTVQVYIL